MLTDKIALVTGASRGIGAAVAKLLAANGAYVYVNYNGSKERADEVVNEIINAGGQAEAIKCDVSDYNATKEMIDAVMGAKGRLDILVNNAGITRDKLLMQMSEEDYDAVLDTNLKGCFNTIRHVSRYLLKQRSGKIINMSSVSGVMGNAGQANYSSAKAGVIGLTKSVAKELASRGINCNAVAPGFIDTEMTQSMSDKAKEATLQVIPLGRTGSTEDIAKAVLFLASDMSDYITGQVISVDGGMNI